MAGCHRFSGEGGASAPPFYFAHNISGSARHRGNSKEGIIETSSGSGNVLT
jgi:hypothetical protein